MAGIAPLVWTFTTEVEPTQEIKDVLIEGEEVFCAYKTIRDIAAITNKRIIIADKQGITGKKVEIYSLPFRSIDMYSSENAKGILDINAEMEFWTKAGHIKLNLNKGIDIRKLDRHISKHVLG